MFEVGYLDWKEINIGEVRFYAEYTREISGLLDFVKISLIFFVAEKLGMQFCAYIREGLKKNSGIFH